MNKKISILLIVTMVFSLLGGLPFNVEKANGLSYGDYSIIEELSSTNNNFIEYFNVRTPLDEDNTIYVEGKTHIDTKLICLSLKSCDTAFETVLRVFVKPDENGDFSVKIDTSIGNQTTPEILGDKGTVITKEQSYGTMPGYVAVPEISKGFYRLLVTKAVTTEDADVSYGTTWWESSLSGDYGYVWKDAVFVVENENNPKLVSYDTVISQADDIHASLEKTEDKVDGFEGSYVRYLDTTLADINYLFNNDVNQPFKGLSSEEISYISELADEITLGATTDYEKSLKIFEYLASNFYYDRFAFKNKIHQLGNPYENLYALNNGGTNANVSGKKVATICDGFSAMFIAMARTEGIPARMVSGIALGTKDNWGDFSNYDEDTHWWAEAYVDGKWITVDAERGCVNFWERSSTSDAGTWSKQGYINYSSFDIDPVTVANTYLLNNILIGSRDRNFFCYENEVSKFNHLLEYSVNGIKNGTLLNMEYNNADLSTWGPKEFESTLGDGYGRAYQLLWNDKGLEGSADFGGFEKLRFLYLGGNHLDDVSLDGCVSLEKFSAFGNDLKDFDSGDSINLTGIDVRENPLETATFVHEGNKVSITAELGTFSMRYDASSDKPLTIFVDKPDVGIIFKGIYTDDDELVTTDLEYSFDPNNTTYRVVFEDNSANLLATPVVTISNNPWTGNITLNWDIVPGAEYYQIYRFDSEDNRYEKYDTCVINEYVNTSPKLGETYFYQVSAVCSDETKTSFRSEIVSGTKILGCPSLNKTETDQASGGVALYWNQVEGADAYVVYRATEEDGIYNEIGQTSYLSYLDESGDVDIRYYYKVKAIVEGNPMLDSCLSNALYRTMSCGTPELISTNDAEGNPFITWEPIRDVENYSVYYSETENGTYNWVSYAPDCTYMAKELSLGEKGYYKVRAYKGSSYSAYSEPMSAVRILPAPTDVKVNNVASSGKPKITWTAVEGANKYYIYRSTSKDGPYSYLGSTANTNYTNTGATAGACYYYKVQAVLTSDEVANSIQSDYCYITCDLAAPTNVKVSNVASSGKPKVSWSAVTGANKYYVYRATSKEGTYSYLGSTTNTYYTNTGAVAGTCYYYKVKAVMTSNENATSAHSSYCYITCDLPSPTGVKVSNVASSGKPKVTWNAVAGANKYYVYRSTSKDGTYSYLGSTTNTYYNNTGAVAGTCYYYKVKAVMTSNENATSAQSSYCYITCDLAAPTNVKVSNVASSGKPKITWTAVTGANKYYVYRSTSKDGTYSYLGSTTNTYYTNTGAVAGTCYYYKVKAVMTSNENATSAQSSYNYITCDLPQPVVKISLSNGKPKISWTAVSGAEKYEVYRKVGNNGTYSKYYTTNSTSMTNTSAAAGTTYYFKVIAVCKTSSYGNSVYSNEVSITSK